jgi:hypothetical protein
VYYVDDLEIKAITGVNRETINTCFHEHYGREHVLERAVTLVAIKEVGRVKEGDKNRYPAA